MSVPKSVIKVKKSGVEYISNVDFASYTIRELTRAALRDVGKFVRKSFRTGIYTRWSRITGNAPYAVTYKVVASNNTIHPRVEIGIEHSTKGKPVRGFYAFFLEHRDSMLADIVEHNVPEIVKIESQYLSALEDEARALSLISEDEYGGEDDD